MPENQSAVDTLLKRKVHITCTPTLIWYNDSHIEATVVFTQTYGEPAAMNGRVAADGAIDLTNMPEDKSYNDNIDVTINLDDSRMVDPHGNHIAGRWAYDTEYSGTVEVTGYGWFCEIDANGKSIPSHPIKVDNMAISRLNDTSILIEDNTPELMPPHEYCLGLVLSGHNNYYMTIDPRITTKTTPPESDALMMRGDCSN